MSRTSLSHYDIILLLQEMKSISHSISYRSHRSTGIYLAILHIAVPDSNAALGDVQIGSGDLRRGA